MSIRLDKPALSSISIDGRRVRVADLSAAWLRLIDLSSPARSDELVERATAFNQAVATLLPQAEWIRVVNPPRPSRFGFAKLVHAVSHAAGPWRIPRSRLTNDPTAAELFADSCPNGAIVKGASSVKTWAARYEPAHDGPRLKYIRTVPVLFQELIDGPDVRVHLVGTELFAERTLSSRVDYRVDRYATHEGIQLPPGIASGCLALGKETGVPFLGIDFKVQSDTGEWFFLEANSMPAYQGYDLRAGGAISAALVRWLMNESTARGLPDLLQRSIR
jgi:hypothetical protein